MSKTTTLHVHHASLEILVKVNSCKSVLKNGNGKAINYIRKIQLVVYYQCYVLIS